jgi:lysophospholipase L1-like esterase
MVDDKKGLTEDYTYDGVHPNNNGYTIMESLLEMAIAATLEK